MTFFRTTEREAETTPGLTLATRLEGIPLYIHGSLVEHFAAHPLILTARGPRIAIEKGEALAELEARLIRDLVIGHHEH
ncbi:MAG: hypothetical protein HY260_20770 [Chloroflexi bacterium]|nr:hypothetical protein [Chloroflexota bacterium]